MIIKGGRVAADSIGEDNPIEEILLTGFPNPERKGCPHASIIEDLGNRKIGRDHPAWKHIWGCSPCFRQFKTIRDARVARVEKAERDRRNRRRFLVTAAASIPVMAGGYLIFSEVRSRSPHGLAIVAIDLRNAGARRGSAEGDEIVAKLPKQLTEVRLTLPQSMHPGQYIVAVLESKSDYKPVALASGIAKGPTSALELVVNLDLAEVPAGQYFLGIRLDEHGQQDPPDYYPVTIFG